MTDKTKLIYYIDDEKTPFMITLNMPPEKATLREFKSAFPNPKAYKFFFQTIVADFGDERDDYGVVVVVVVDDYSYCCNGDGDCSIAVCVVRGDC